MSLERVEQAKRDAATARRRLDSTLGALQLRLKPANLAGEAWDGVKDKSADLADTAVDAVKKRPGIASAAVGAVALFLARGPLMRAVGRLVSGEEDEERDGDAHRDDDALSLPRELHDALRGRELFRVKHLLQDGLALFSFNIEVHKVRFIGVNHVAEQNHR